MKRLDGFERPNSNGPELANAAASGREPGRLQVEDDELGLLQQWVGSPSGKRDSGARTDDPTVTGGHLGQQGASEAFGDGGGGKERTGSLGS